MRAWIAAWLLACSGVVAAQDLDLELARLDADPPAAEVLAGRHDAGLQVQSDARVLFEPERSPRWWRITARADIPADLEPQLVLEAPYSTRVRAWVPGGHPDGSLHAIYGTGSDDRHAGRALVVALPEGLSAGQAAWLRVDAPAGFPMPVSVATRDAVQRADLAHVAWRSANLTALLVLALLAVGFWIGSGDRSYGGLAGMLLAGGAYLAMVGGEARWWPALAELIAASPQPARLAAFLGMVCSNWFQQRYLDLPRRLPRLGGLLRATTMVIVALALVTLASDAAWIATAGNFALLLSAVVVLVASARLALGGDRPGLLVLVSWLPLALLSAVRGLELNDAWSGPAWLGSALAGSFVLAGLLLTLGLADKLLQLRRDRDLASARADVDAMTQAASRPAIERALDAAVERAHASGQPLSLAFIDLDRFKQVNDTWGHNVGDGVLRETCRRVRALLRKGDLLGRHGGDELLVLLPATGLDAALRIAERMRAAIDGHPMAIDGHLVASSLSLGLAELRPGEGAESLLHRADAALYASKDAGRNRVTHDPGHHPDGAAA